MHREDPPIEPLERWHDALTALQLLQLAYQARDLRSGQFRTLRINPWVDEADVWTHAQDEPTSPS